MGGRIEVKDDKGKFFLSQAAAFAHLIIMFLEEVRIVLVLITVQYFLVTI